MQFFNSLLHLGLLLGCALPAGKATAAEFDEVVARMGGVELHATEVRKLIEAQSPDVRLRIQSGAPALERLIRKELVRRAVLQEAYQKGWDQRPEIVQKMNVAVEQVIVSTYVDNLTRPSADYPAEDEIRAAYKNGKDTFKMPSQPHDALIYVAATAENEMTAAEADQAKTISPTEKTRNEMDDAATHAQTSDEHRQGAEPHHETDRQSEDHVRPVLGGAAPIAKTGDISTAIRNNSGWHIEMKPAAAPALADVRESIVQRLRWRKARENEAKFLEELASRSSVEIDQASLAKALNKR